MIRAFSNNAKVIAKVASYGGIVSMFCSVIVSMTFPILMGVLVKKSGWLPLILIYAVPMMLIGILRFIFVKEDPAVDMHNAKKVTFKEIFSMLKINKYSWVFAGIMGLHSVITGLNVGTYFFTYIIGDIKKYSMVSALTVVLLPVMFIFPKLMKKINVTGLFAIFSIISTVGYLLVFIGGDNFAIVMIGITLGTLLNLPVSYLGPLVIMQLATYNENHGLPRMEGSSNIVSGFALKVGGGIGGGLVGIMLAVAGFVTSTDGTAVQPDSAMVMIQMLYSIVPAILCFLTFLLSRSLRHLIHENENFEKDAEQD